MAGCTFQISERTLLVFNVSNQIVRPMIRVNNPQTTLKYPLNFTQPLVIGITIPGMVMRKVKKTMTAFPMAAIYVSIDYTLRERDTHHLVDMSTTTSLEPHFPA